MEILSSYRFQVTRQLHFDRIASYLPYLKGLGVRSVFLSPIFQSRSESAHGYDATDPTKISEDRGGEVAFCRLLDQAKKHGLSIILDIVPNHMAVSHENPYWWNVLKEGPSSKYYGLFDWLRREPFQKIILPVLGGPLNEVVGRGEIQLGQTDKGEPCLKYYENLWPLNSQSVAGLGDRPEAGPISGEQLLQLLDRQYYLPQFWKTASKELNYRRFFDINELVSLNMQDEENFSFFHEKLQKMIQKSPVVNWGLRVDHIDGLADPAEYFGRLHSIVPAIWIEKILGEDEPLAEWPISGTTGYEVSSHLDKLFVFPTGFRKIEKAFCQNSRWKSFNACVYEQKKKALENLFESERKNLKRLVDEVFEPSLSSAYYQALLDLAIHLPVYRTYWQERDGFSELDRGFLAEAAEACDVNSEVLEALFPSNSLPGKYPELIQRWQQLTGPLMAKGLEDTGHYVYTPLCSLNEVGSEPTLPKDAQESYLALCKSLIERFPQNMVATSTHDSKRSEDARARLNVLSERADIWLDFIEEQKAQVTGPSYLPPEFKQWPFLNFFFQNLFASWPLQASELSKEQWSVYVDRVQQYFLKAGREAEEWTSWLSPDESKEARLNDWLQELLQRDEPFFAKFNAMVKQYAIYGAINSLSLVTLKILGPGVPDTYQGCEVWDFSLVDPDNRRRSDFEDLVVAMESLGQDFSDLDWGHLCNHWQDGRVKMAWLRSLLQERNQWGKDFFHASITPVDFTGEGADHFFGFVREFAQQRVAVCVPRWVCQRAPALPGLDEVGSLFPGVKVHLPPGKWSAITGDRQWQLTEEGGASQINVARLLDPLPVAVLTQPK